jgi:hypothetical protein
MAKQQHSVKLIAHSANGEPLTPQSCSYENPYFHSQDGAITVTYCDGGVRLISHVGEVANTYVLEKHPSLNIYVGECNGIKVHVALKQMVGKVIYWS